jgi:hypothetical protein
MGWKAISLNMATTTGYEQMYFVYVSNADPSNPPRIVNISNNEQINQVGMGEMSDTDYAAVYPGKVLAERYIIELVTNKQITAGDYSFQIMQ